MSLLKKNFSGAPDNVLRVLRAIILENGKNDFPIEKIINTLRGTNKSIIFTDDDIDVLLEKQYGKAETLTILMLLYPSLDFNNKFHIDHIYPKSIFNKKNLIAKGVDEQRIPTYIEHVNDISNLQLLAAIPNIEKKNQDFDSWFNSICKTEEARINYRIIHYLPNMEYTYSDFDLFLQNRRKLLKEKLQELLL